MTTYICKCGRRVKKSTDASTTGNRLSGYAPGHECWGCPYAMPYGNYQWDESARTVSRETQGYECRMSKTLTYASEFAGSIKDKCTCRVHSLDFDFLSQVSAWIKDTYPDREIFGSFSKDIRASDYGSDGRYCLTITCTQNLKGVAAKRELLGQFFTPNGSRKDMTPQQEMEKVLTDIKNSRALVKEESSLDVPAPCICSTCTCGGCKEECFGNCRSCGHPVQECNSYQTEGEKHLTPAHSEDVAEPFGNIPAAPTFDFSALGDLSQQATEADQQFDLHYGAAQDEYLISCIYLARIHALTAKAGRYGGGTWTKWYESKGMSKSGAWKMLKSRLSCPHSHFDGTCNPESPSHWFKKFLDSDADIYCQAYTIDDNPTLPAQFVADLKKEYTGTVYYNRFILGQWMAANGVIYRLLADSLAAGDRRFFWPAEKQLHPWRIRIGVDFGGNGSKHAFVATAILPGWSGVVGLASRRIDPVAQDADYLADKLIEFCIAVFARWGEIQYIFCDSAEQTLINHIRARLRRCKLSWLAERVENSAKIKITDRIRLTCILMGGGRFWLMPEAATLRDALATALYSGKHPGVDERLDDGSTDIDTLDAYEYTIERDFKRLTNT